MTLEVATVIYLRERIDVLRREAPPRTAAGRESLQATIDELEAHAQRIATQGFTR